MRLQREARTLFTTGLPAICVTFWQRIWPESVFCSCPKNSRKTKLISNGLKSLEEVILRQHNMESMAWLLLITLMWIWKEKKPSGTERNIKSTVRREKEHQEA